MRLTMLATLALITGCEMEVHQGNGDEATEVRAVDAFDRVAAEMSIEVAVAEGQALVEVTCDENLLEDIETVVEDGELHVRGARRGSSWIGIAPEAACHVWVQTPTLAGAASTGSGRLVVTGETSSLAQLASTGSGGALVEAQLEGPQIDIANTGSGGVEIGSVRAGLLTVSSSGSGDTQILGESADRIELTVTGSGSVHAIGVVAGEVEATLTASGEGEVTATEGVSARLTGSGGLVVHGDPDGRDVVETGSGAVRFEP